MQDKIYDQKPTTISFQAMFLRNQVIRAKFKDRNQAACPDMLEEDQIKEVFLFLFEIE